jgi:hypothetical protein
MGGSGVACLAGWPRLRRSPQCRTASFWRRGTGAVSGLNTTEVREWAKARGIEVKDRGRVPPELVITNKKWSL